MTRASMFDDKQHQSIYLNFGGKKKDSDLFKFSEKL